MAITRVNTTSGADYSGGNSATIAAAAANHTTGNFLVVGVRAAGGNFTSVTDTAGNFYRRIGRSTLATSTLDLYIARNITGHATNVVTGNLAVARQFRGIVVAQYSGIATTIPPLDAMPSVIGERTLVGTTMTTLAFTTMLANELLVALSQIDTSPSTWTPDTGFSTAVQDSGTVVYLQDRIVSSIQTGITISVTNSSGAGKDILAASFIEEPGGGGGGGGGESGYASIGG